MLTWASRRKTALWGALVLVFAMTGTAGATAGAMLHLGVVNTRNATTTLTGSTSGPEMKIINNGSATALALQVDSNRPAFSVNTTARIPKLNADRLDSLDSTQLQRRISSGCVEGSAISHVSANGSVSCERDDIDGGDAATLGGIAASGFYAAGSKVLDSLDADHADVADSAKVATTAGNATTVGGLPPSAFMRSTVNHTVSDRYTNPALSQTLGTASCGTGFVAIGGGVATSPTPSTGWNGFEPSTQSVNSSYPTAGGRGWSVAVTNHGESSKTFQVYVICVPGQNVVVTGTPESAP